MLFYVCPVKGGAFRDWKVSASFSPGFSISISKIRPFCEGQGRTVFIVYHSCRPCLGLSFWWHCLSLHYTAGIYVFETCVTEGERRSKRQTETDSGSGFWPLYCIFQWRLHIPETRPHDWRDGGACESERNHCWAKLNRRSDGGVEPSTVTDYLCVAFPSSEKRPCRQEQRAGPHSKKERLWGRRDKQKTLNINTHQHSDRHLTRSNDISWRSKSQTASRSPLDVSLRMDRVKSGCSLTSQETGSCRGRDPYQEP